jgi:hypothetical protein
MDTLLRPHSAAPRSCVWVRGPIWDSAWILNALWLLPLALWLAHGYSDPALSPLDSLYFGLTALFWIGHRLSSTWLAYCSEAYRPLLRCDPVRFVVLPLLITFACFVVFLPADEALPWTREERLVAMAILDYAFVTYHFAAQHFGALSLYRMRAERAGSRYTRHLDRVFALGVGGALVFLSDILAGSVAYQDLWVGRWAIPNWLAVHQDAVGTASLSVLLLATAFMLITEWRTPHRSLPRVLYILGLAAMVAIALRPRNFAVYLVIWNAQHWVLATGLASQTMTGEPVPARGGIRRALHALNTRPWAFLLLFSGSSVLLLPFFEVEANWDNGGTNYGDRIFGAFPDALRDSDWVPALVALGFATGFVHYLLDRSVYRMSDPRIRSAARGLIEQRHTVTAAR